MSIDPSSLSQLSQADRSGRNRDLYDGWAPTYDTDGNALPLLDGDIFDERVVPLIQARATEEPTRVLEIGCGTGKNTATLASLLGHDGGNMIYAIDVSQGMIQEAKVKLEGNSIHWALLDFQTQDEDLAAFVGDPVDIVISTLVLGHVDLDAFFATVGRHLAAGGWAWVSTMHPSIGRITEAGYRLPDGAKITGVTINYGVAEIVDTAKKYGLEVEADIVEAGVGDDEAEAAVKYGARAKKWAGHKIFLGVLFRKS